MTTLYTILILIATLFVLYVFWKFYCFLSGVRKPGEEDLPRLHLRYLFRFHQRWIVRWRMRSLLPLTESIYLLGKSGSGKSELLKIIFYTLAFWRTAILILDPHGTFARQAARLKFKPRIRERITYLSPEVFAGKGLIPRWNPLELPEDFGQYSATKQETLLARKVNNLVASFETILESELTPQMSLLLKYAIRLILSIPDTDFSDLLNLLRQEKAAPYLELAKRHPDEGIRSFFGTVFIDQRMISTKLAIRVRLETMLEGSIVKHILSGGKSTFDLKTLIEEGKIIIVNLDKGLLGDGTRLLGSLLTAEVLTHVMTRGKGRRTTLIADECQIIASRKFEEVLSEGRKFFLNLICANQHLGQLRDYQKVVKDSLMTNAHKIIGKTSYEDLSVMSRNMGIHPDLIPELGEGRFVVSTDYHKKVLIAPDFLLTERRRRYLDSGEWASYLQGQFARYYSKVTVQPIAFAASPEAGQEPPSATFNPEIDTLL